jgi:hypothetical protein
MGHVAPSAVLVRGVDLDLRDDGRLDLTVVQRGGRADHLCGPRGGQRPWPRMVDAAAAPPLTRGLERARELGTLVRGE